MKRVNYEVFTTEETKQAVVDGLDELGDTDIIDIVRDWGRMVPDERDELLAQLENDVETAA